MKLTAVHLAQTSTSVGHAHAIDAGIREGQEIAPYLALPLTLAFFFLVILVTWKLWKLVK